MARAGGNLASGLLLTWYATALAAWLQQGVTVWRMVRQALVRDTPMRIAASLRARAPHAAERDPTPRASGALLRARSSLPCAGPARRAKPS
eukprot:15195986-Alexandrium_andersonii.AAC.1